MPLYSHQLAIEENPKLQPTFHDSLPALKGCTTSSIIPQKLNAIAAVHRVFVQTEISAKKTKALKHPARHYCDVMFKPNDNDFYK